MAGQVRCSPRLVLDAYLTAVNVVETTTCSCRQEMSSHRAGLVWKLQTEIMVRL
jgi:hypothetical protein